MVGKTVQNARSLYSFTLSAVIVFHKNTYSHSTTKLTFKKYVYSHLTVSVFLIQEYIDSHLQGVFIRIQWGLCSFKFMIEIFIQHFLCITFGPSSRSVILWVTKDQRPQTKVLHGVKEITGFFIISPVRT